MPGGYRAGVSEPGLATPGVSEPGLATPGLASTCTIICILYPVIRRSKQKDAYKHRWQRKTILLGNQLNVIRLSLVHYETGKLDLIII